MDQRDPNQPAPPPPPGPEHEPEQPASVERALQATPDPRRAVGAPMAAMAEALRANAEALRVLDANQRKMAESMEKTDKATQVVASTRALNETFRGLSEIQKGLLDAVVKNPRGGGGGGPMTFLLFLLLAGLTGVGAVFVMDRVTADEKVPRALYEEAKRAADTRAEQIASLRERVRTAEGKAESRDGRLDDRLREIETVKRERDDLQRQLTEQEGELKENKAQLANFLQVKQQADLAGQLQVRNLQLEQDNRRLRERMDLLEKKNEKLLGNFGDMLLDMRGGDKEAILEMARKMGVFKEPPDGEGTREPGAAADLNRRGERLVKEQLNRLFPDEEESYMVLGVKGIAQGSVLREVMLGEYNRGTMVKSLTCKELTIRVDVERDTVELRLKDGHIVNIRRPAEKIPFSEDGHSIFLGGVGLKNWLRRVGAYISVDDTGMLTWKTTPS